MLLFLVTNTVNEQTGECVWMDAFFFVICWNLCLAIQKIFDRHLKPVIGPTS